MLALLVDVIIAKLLGRLDCQADEKSSGCDRKVCLGRNRSARAVVFARDEVGRVASRL